MQQGRSETSIHDAVWSLLPSPSGPGTPLLAADDHWLRRFGRIDWVRLSPGGSHRSLRRSADEVWILLSGAVTLELRDTRPASPSSETVVRQTLDGLSRVLVPFGVELRIEAVRESSLLRVMTHTEAEDPPD